MATNLSELLQLSRNQMNELRKADILDILEAAEPPAGDIQPLVESVNKLTAEFVGFKVSIKTDQEASQKQIDDLKQQVTKQGEIIAKQQQFLEQIDRKERECNIVIQGVPEENVALDGATSDDDKVKKIWDTATVTANVNSIKRLGKPDTDRKRPILVVLDSKLDRDNILEKAKKLKEAGESFKNIFIKKDVHPSVRGEWKRLFDAEKTEKARPENQGSNISFNIRERKLYKDGTVIDQWALQGF